MKPLPALSAAFARLPAPIKGGVLMVLACAGFAGMNVVIRILSYDLPAFEIVFFRNLMSFVFMVPWLCRVGVSAMKTDRHGLYFGRSMIGFASMLLWFSALTMMPLAEATALSFTAPLFATLAAIVILHEVVRLRRWSATIVGFIGAMIVLRPGVSAIDLPALLVLASSATSGINAIIVKQLTRTQSANMIVTYMTLYILPVSFVVALFVWVWPPLHTLPYIVLLGILATFAHLCSTRAFGLVDTSVAMAFDFARLPFVALFAWFTFNEVPDIWTWVGAAVIVSASVYIAHREAQIARAARKAAESNVAPARHSTD
jgi:drug/metabolite transporter (DMT)-like permease